MVTVFMKFALRLALYLEIDGVFGNISCANLIPRANLETFNQSYKMFF
jgi:hypothetical protein